MTDDHPPHDKPPRQPRIIYGAVKPPIPNYTLSTVCPNCEAPTVRRACKVRCERCGFMWDCSEL
ncbi:MAG: transposase [Anaerolineaceae bacterium]|nr:MAG: transposase [Anaerolineaceae bacterium]